MKKFFKVLGVIVGGYAIWNTLCLAYIGAGRIVKRFAETYPNGSIAEIDGKVLNDAADDWRVFIKRIKGEA